MPEQQRGLRGIYRTLVNTPATTWALYLIVYLAVGFTVQGTADYTRVARFLHDWQVITLYGFWLVPLSLALRDLRWFDQYAYSLVALAPTEIVGFAFGTSLPYTDNFFDRTLGPYNFTLVLVVCAGFIPVIGNFVLARVLTWVSSSNARSEHVPEQRQYAALASDDSEGRR